MSASGKVHFCVCPKSSEMISRVNILVKMTQMLKYGWPTNPFEFTRNVGGNRGNRSLLNFSYVFWGEISQEISYILTYSCITRWWFKKEYHLELYATKPFIFYSTYSCIIRYKNWNNRQTSRDAILFTLWLLIFLNCTSY